MTTTQELWNGTYSRHEWNYLSELSEAPRYAIIGGYISHFPTVKKVLDVGCGEGLLQAYLDSSSQIQYTGLDCSSRALQNLQTRQPAINVICIDAAEYTPEHGDYFDVIVFNEILYYMQNPIRLLAKYMAFLSESGLLVISMYCNNLPGQEVMAKRVSQIWERIAFLPWSILDHVVVENELNKKKWRIQLLRGKTTAK